MLRAAAVSLLLWAIAAPAWADQPLLRPNRDVDVTYRTVAPKAGPGEAPGGGARDAKVLQQRVRWLAAAQTMRIDPPSPGLHVIIDYLAGRMSVVRDATRSVVEMAAPDNLAEMPRGRAAGFVRAGEATVAGQRCTEWQTLDRDARPVVVCITADGVLLRAATANEVRVSAVSVRYGPQDPEVFRIPADYAHHAPRGPR
jgi:hypothetical protein